MLALPARTSQHGLSALRRPHGHFTFVLTLHDPESLEHGAGWQTAPHMWPQPSWHSHTTEPFHYYLCQTAFCLYVCPSSPLCKTTDRILVKLLPQMNMWTHVYTDYKFYFHFYILIYIYFAHDKRFSCWCIYWCDILIHWLPYQFVRKNWLNFGTHPLLHHKIKKLIDFNSRIVVIQWPHSLLI